MLNCKKTGKTGKKGRSRLPAVGILAAVTALFFALCAVYLAIPGEMAVFEGTDVLQAGLPVVYETVTDRQAGTVAEVQAKLFGVLPLKTVSVSILPKTTLTPSGQTFGVKLFTEGVLVVGLTEVDTGEGKVSPGKEAGLELGDILLTVNGHPLTGNEDLSRLVASGGGQQLVISYRRGEDTRVTALLPARTAEGYKAGLWVRDSTAGLGTLTFVEKETGLFGGLGHGIYDVDTGQIMPVRTAEVVSATVVEVVRGFRGTPGEIIGNFNEEQIIGSLLGNSDTGVFGLAEDVSWLGTGGELETASYGEIREGKATILCDVTGEGVREYEIEILRVIRNSGYSSKNMSIRVTDPELLALTGGIVQGMSGSPILQNGKLIGAVTHVLVNDPTEGFGIFIENMLEEMRRAALSAA